MAFSSWIQTHKLDPEIVRCLKDEDLDDIELLKEFPEEEMINLSLKPEHKAALSKALRAINDRTDELVKWASEKRIKPESVQKLIDGGIKNLDALMEQTSDSFQKLQINAGQRILLNKGIAELKAQRSESDNQSSKEGNQEAPSCAGVQIALDDSPPAYSQTQKRLPAQRSESDNQLSKEGIQEAPSCAEVQIASDDSPPAYSPTQKRLPGKDSAPIPTKATRGTSSRVSASRRVPPIPAVTKLEDSSRRVPGESARDSGLSGMIQEQEEPNERERDASLRQIRNSASKKQVDKLWSQAEAWESRTPSPNDNGPLEESGIFSNFSTLRSNTDETDSSRSKQSGKKENPFESRPRLARKNSVQTSKTDLSSKSNTPQDSVRSNIQSDSVAKFDSRPIGGVTFRENNTADLAMVGKGYSEDARPVEPKPSQVAQKARERRRVGKNSEYVRYLIPKQLKEETIHKLLDTLHLMDGEEVDKLELSKPQEHYLSSLLQESKTKPENETTQLTYDQAYEQFLTEISLDKTTIDKITNFGMESPEELTLLRKEDIMQLPPEQRCILEDAIAKLRTIDKDQTITSSVNNEAKSTNPLYAATIGQTSAGRVSQSTSKGSECSFPGETTQQGGFFGALGRFANKVGKAKTGVANAITYLRRSGTETLEPKIKMVNGMRIVKLPVKQGFEDDEGKVRKCIIGNPDLKKEQKTIMVVGATGAGKSTLIDGLCSYIFDTKWEEKNRFQLIDEHTDELRNAAKGQAMSQTEWITIYTINSGDSNRLPFTLNLIDTPGFGDTRGITKDQRLVEQIRSLFQNRGKHEIDEIDAVCFVAKAPDARLTPTHRYIFNSILSVFGKDIEGNILVMITFADGAKSPVLDAINAAKLPYRKAFPFNNSALFANNGIAGDKNTASSTSNDQVNDATTMFGKMFWDMGIHSFKLFFDYLGTMTPKSLVLTSQVLEQRKNLKETLSKLEVKIRVRLSTMDQLKQKERIARDHENRKDGNKKYTYKQTKTTAERVYCSADRNVTHCMNCYETCHSNCIHKNDENKAFCNAMDQQTGFCIYCKNRCHWKDHTNSGYYLEDKTETVELTYDKMFAEFKDASGKLAQTQQMIKKIKAEHARCEAEVKDYMNRCRTILQKLREIALKPDPLTEVDYIDELIRTEKDDHKEGWDKRVEQLEKIKKQAQTLQTLT